MVLFIIQLTALLVLGAGAVPALYERHLVATPLFVAGTVAVLGGVLAAIAELARLIPVRCNSCESRARFHGAGWWPFTYRYACTHCGYAVRYEVGGR